MANLAPVNNYRVMFDDGISRDYLFTLEEIDDWVHESNQLFEMQDKSFRIIRVEDNKGSLVWPASIRSWSRGREIAMMAIICTWVFLGAYSLMLILIGKWSIALLPVAAAYYFYSLAVRFQRHKERALREGKREAAVAAVAEKATK